MNYDDYPTSPQEQLNLILSNHTLFTPPLPLTSWLLHPLFTQTTPIHHIIFQISNLFLSLIFISSNKCIKKILIIFYSCLLISWGYFIICSFDVVFWGLFYILIVFISSLVEFIKKSCYCCGGGSKEVEQVYKKLFQPLHVSKSQFRKILSCKRNMRVLSAGEHYATEKSTRVDSLALLIKGKLLVSQSGRPLHLITTHQFVDSPEYFGVSTDEIFQVTIAAVEESKILVWHRDKLRLTILADEFLREMFDHIIGRDVVRKLIQVSDSVTLTNGYYNNTKEESEPMLTIVDSNFETSEIWSLTKIAEEETPV